MPMTVPNKWYYGAYCTKCNTLLAVAEAPHPDLVIGGVPVGNDIPLVCNRCGRRALYPPSKIQICKGTDCELIEPDRSFPMLPDELDRTG